MLCSPLFAKQWKNADAESVVFDVSGTEQSEDVEQLLHELTSLDLEYREIIVAKIWGGLTLEDIAEVTKSSRSSVHRKYQEGIRRLKEKMKE